MGKTKLKITLDNSGRTGFNRQIASQIEKSISNGEISPEDTLPSEIELSKQLHTSRSVIRSAYDILKTNGILESLHGKGWVVKSCTSSDLSKTDSE